MNSVGSELAEHAAADAHDDSSEHTPDLASEWEHSLSVDEHAPVAEISAAEVDADASSNPEIAETVEEIRFYLEHFMTDQAHAGIEKLESLTSDARILDPLRAAVASAAQPPAEPEPEIAEINADEISTDEINAAEIGTAQPADFEVEVQTDHESDVAGSSEQLTGYHSEPHDEVHDEASVEPAPGLEPMHVQPAVAEVVHAETSELTEFVADLEASLGDSFPQAPAHDTKPLPSWPVAPSPATAPTLEREAQPVARGLAPQQPKVEIKTPAAAMPAIAASAGGAAAAPAMSYSAAPVRPLGAGAQAMHASDSVDLSEMFGALKQELEEEVAVGDSDPETHYNLGVAFREMGLLDEAIAELQKVCIAIDRGLPFSQPVQTYTWLAQCFLDKGVPEAAIRWYEKALNIPGLDDEARLAINYELGSACETASDKPAALRHFTAVYGTNIDYRDVAERIQGLKS